MSARIVQRFLWSILLLIAVSLTGLILYVRRHDPALFAPLGAASLVIFLIAAALAAAFAKAFAKRTSRLRDYTERLLDPRVAEYELPFGDDQLGALGQSLRRTAPKIQELVNNLKLEGEQREAILSSMVEGVLAVGKDLRVTFCNNSFARTVGTRIPATPGVHLPEIVRDPALLEMMNYVISTGEHLSRRISLVAAGGRSFDVLAGPLAGPSTHGALAILHDVTEIERLERVRKDFVANVSHELRTPLAAIHGYAETLLAGALEDHENNRKFVEVILAQASRLTNIASDLLTLSELERGKDTAPQRISVRAALESALRTVESNAASKQVRLVRSRVDDVAVMAHELRLEQAFVNLLDNAVKFSHPGGEVRAEAQSDDRHVRITISDTGIGIPSEDLPRIFERFYRVDKARSREMGGTGLGLSIVKHAVEQMGGTVSVESRLGEGSTFIIILPRFLGGSSVTRY